MSEVQEKAAMDINNQKVTTVNILDDNGPHIISNELLQSEKNASAEKLDELTSLEREIAEMHHVEPSAPVVAQRVNNTHQSDEDSIAPMTGNVLLEMQPARNRNVVPVDSEAAASKSSQSKVEGGAKSCNVREEYETTSGDALGHDDLIAVLKGIEPSSGDGAADTAASEKRGRNHHEADDDLVEGVTIEGEGEYQIMEVIDDDMATSDEPEMPQQIKTTSSELKSSTNEGTSGKSYGPTVTKLTPEEERAVAMEQMEGLKFDRMRRRKQDIKHLQQAEGGIDLVSSLGADWSDDEVNDNTAASSASNSSTAVIKQNQKVGRKQPPTDDNTKSAPLTTRQTKPPSQVTSVVLLQAGSQLNKTANNKRTNSTAEASNKGGTIETVTEKKETDPKVIASVSSQQTTGFKRTRIIKRKIIWDPDAPETTFSYAQLVRPNAKAKVDSTPISTSVSAATVTTAIKKEPPSKKARPVTPKDKKLSSESADKKPEVPVLRNVSVSIAKSSNLLAVTTTSKSTEDISRTEQSPVKRRAQTPVANGAGTTGAKKKKISEIDRLMGDEGAINMLNSLENERNKIEAIQSGNDATSARPMMRSRAATVCEKVPKRDATTPSKNTTSNVSGGKTKRGSRPRASATWDYVYKKQKAMDDSMIIRRRSNSSYSSTASLQRLSLDGPPTTTSTSGSTSKVSTTKSAETTPASTTTSDSPTKTSPKAIQSSGESPSKALNKSAGSSKGSTTPSTTGKTFEFAKPETKSQQKNNRRTKSPTANPLTSDMKKAASVAGRRNTRSPAIVADDKEKANKMSSTNVNGKETKDSGVVSSPTSDVVVKKSTKVAQIIFNTHKAKLDYTFTAQMMNKLVDILDKLGTDADCNVVVMSTNDPHFCQGIDITDLTLGSAEKRKHTAVLLATAVKNYLKTLATFPKPLIAAVSGNNIGLGVTQLPLFDIVVASDKGSYETPYAKFGQVPEGYCIWNNITKIRGTFKTKLFWLCEKLHSTESALSGLVNKLTTANKVNDEALAIAKKIAAMSTESYRVMKKTTIHSHLDVIVTALDEEFDTIITQWTSNECLENFKKYLEMGHL